MKDVAIPVVKNMFFEIYVKAICLTSAFFVQALYVFSK